MAKFLYRNKKGATNLTVAAVVIIIVGIASFFLIAGVLGWWAKGQKGEAAEAACYTTNAFNVGVLPQTSRAVGVEFKGCQTVDKQDIPSDAYKDSPEYVDRKEAAKAQIAAMVAQCWKNWLSGIRDENGENEDVLATSYGDLGNDKACFVCNTFSLDKKTGEIKREELSHYLAGTPYIINDPSDKCAASGGGFCYDECPTGFPRVDLSSKKCKIGQKCCLAADSRDECVNKGGACREDWQVDFAVEGDKIWARYNKWKCRKGNCYVKQENFFSYVDYVQRSGGPGMIVFSKSVIDNNLNPGFQYAVVFNEDTKADELIDISAGVVGGASGLIAGGAVGAVAAVKLAAVLGTAGTFIAPGIGTAIGIVVGVGIGAIVAYGTHEVATGIQNLELQEIDQILIAELGEVNGICKVESGV